MIQVKQGCEDQKFWGGAGADFIPGIALKDLSQKQLQAIMDGDPANARQFLVGEPSALPPVVDNAPDKPLPTKPNPTLPTAKAKEE